MPPQGSGVRFENQGEEFGRPPQEKEGFDILGKLVSWGLVSNRAEAQYVLMAVIVVALLIAVYFLYQAFAGGSDVPTQPVYYGTTQK